jgi:hypothetical protein
MKAEVTRRICIHFNNDSKKEMLLWLQIPDMVIIDVPMVSMM